MAGRNWQEIEKRLASVEGHVRGISRMVAAQAPCPEVARQLLAVRSSVDHLVVKVLDAHLSGCVVEAIGRGDVAAGEAALRELLDILTAAAPSLPAAGVLAEPAVPTPGGS